MEGPWSGATRQGLTAVSPVHTLPLVGLSKTGPGRGPVLQSRLGEFLAMSLEPLLGTEEL